MKKRIAAIAVCAALMTMGAQPVFATEAEMTPAPIETVLEETQQPTEEPTEQPTEAPTEVPTEQPTENPTEAPTEQPTEAPVAELNANAAALTRYAVAGHKAIEVRATISGGIAPYAVRACALLNGNIVYEENAVLSSEGAIDITYLPTAFGVHEIRVTVTDANGAAAECAASVPVAVIERESKSDWEKSLKGVQLGDDWRENILAIARSQLGYRESDRNFIIDGSGKNKGYTRYGDWYGNEYQDWCAIFCAFVVNYAGIPSSAVASGDNSERWREELEYYGAYEARGEYVPQPGDLIFFDRADENGKRDGEAEHVGFVESVSGETVVTIEGNVSREVRRMEYEIGDREILGYGNLGEMMRRAGLEEEALITEALDALGRTNADRVNVRDRASKAGNIAFVIESAGTEIAIQAKITRESGESWYQISANGETGYIYSDLIDLEEKAPNPEAQITENGVTLACAQDGAIRWQRQNADGEWVEAGEGALLNLPADADALLSWYRCVIVNGETETVSEAVRPVRDELIDWLEQGECTPEMILRALNAGSLESVVFEGNQLVYVRTGEVLATYDPESGLIIDAEMQIPVGVLNRESGEILPIAREDASDAPATVEREG